MPSYYTVMRYVPDPVADERINIGVIAYGEKLIRYRFLDDWQRVRAFGGENIDFLHDIVRDITDALGPTPPLTGMPTALFNVDVLQEMIQEWHDSIQFSEPRGSLASPDELLEQIAPRVLVRPEPQRQVTRSKVQIVNAVIEEFKGKLYHRSGQRAAKLLHPGHHLNGTISDYKCDAALANGMTYLAMQAFSFEIATAEELRPQVDASILMFVDAKDRLPELKCGFVVLPPSGLSPTYQRLRDAAQRVAIDVVEEDHLSGWADQRISELPPTAFDEEHAPLGV